MAIAAAEVLMKFRVIIEQDEDGVFVAQCPALPGCTSQGRPRGSPGQYPRSDHRLFGEFKKSTESHSVTQSEEIIDVAV
jgi:hypothetical protein